MFFGVEKVCFRVLLTNLIKVLTSTSTYFLITMYRFFHFCRRFDSVRNLLERARSVLVASTKFRKRSKSREKRPLENKTSDSRLTSRKNASISRDRSQSVIAEETTNEKLKSKDKDNSSKGITAAQSSPNTPLLHRKSRTRSFSPVRY